MPKLLLFVPCRKAVIDPDDDSLSLIDIWDTVNFTLPLGSEPPKNAIAPIPWQVMAVWGQTPEDAGVEYEQRVEVLRPDGSAFAGGVIAFALPDRMHRNKVTIPVTPVDPPGEYTLRLSLRRAGTKGRWQQKAVYPLLVEVITVPPERLMD